MSRSPVRIGSVVVIVAVVAIIALAAYAGLRARNEAAASANGTGLTHDGRWYWASSGRVVDSALGDQVAAGVAFQDTSTTLRAIDGFAPEVALAAMLPSLDGSPGGPRWTNVSTDQDRGTNPSAYEDSAAVLER